MRLHLLHRTSFRYDGNARDSFNEARLQPADDEGQRLASFALRIDPKAQVTAFRDYFGNSAHRFTIADPHPSLVVDAESTVETQPNAARPPVPAVAPDSAEALGDLDAQVEFLQPSRYVPLDDTLEEAARSVLPERGPLWDDVVKLARHVHRSLVYRPQSTGVDTLASDALRMRAGVCQDFAHVTLGLCRCAGVPARYVSGYFFNVSLRPGEVEASHAWIEASIPGRGWVGFDPTHDRPADERYIRLAAGRDYGDIRPIAGTYRGSSTREMRVEVSVRTAEPVAFGPRSGSQCR